MKVKLQQIIVNIFYLYSVQGLNLILPILILPYLIKTLSIESFGIYSFAFAFSQFVVLFVDFGFNISATKKIAENTDRDDIVKATFWHIIFIKFILTLISLVLVGIFIVFSQKTAVYSTSILYAYVMVIGTAIFPIWWFQGMNKMRELSIISAISKLVSYPLIFVFVKDSNDYNSAIVIQSLSYLLAGVFSFGYLYKYYNDYFVDFKVSTNIETYKHEIKESFPIFLSNSSISLYTNSLTILLGIFSTQYNVGLFGALERIVRMICFGLLAPINQVVFPVIANLKKNNFFQARKLFFGTLLVTLLIMITIYIIFLVFNTEITGYLFNEYHDIGNLLIIFMLMIFPISLGGVIGQLGLLALGGEKEKNIFSKIYIGVGILSLPFTVYLIYFYNLNGAVISMMTVEMVIFLLFLMSISKSVIKKI